MNRFVRTTCLTTFAGAALFSAPAYAAPTAGPGVSATPSITYTTDGTTVAFNFNLKGTQHYANGPDHTTTRTPGPISMSVDFGDGKGRTGGDSGVLQCTSKGVSPLNFSSPYQYRYAKPGTYKVKLDFRYCGDANNSHVTKTVDVKVDATPAPPGKGGIKPFMNSDLFVSSSGRTLTYDFVAQGVQHYVSTNGGTPYPNKDLTGYQIDFGDGKSTGGNGTGGATCTNVGADPVYLNLDNRSHTYAKAGTYTVKATGYYCGNGGEKTVTSTKIVKIGASAQPVPTPSKPGTPGGTTTGSTTVGPKVQTDMTHEGSSTNTTAAFAGGALLVAAGGTLVVRRRTR